MDYNIDTGSKPRLLVADDESDNRLLLSAIFSKEYDVHAVVNEEEGLLYILAKNPDIVITDVEMHHRTNGFVMAVEARQQGYQGPIIILSGKYTPDMGHLEKIMGFSDARQLPNIAIGGKPFKLREIKDLVSSMVSYSNNKTSAAQILVDSLEVNPSTDYSG